MSFALIYWLVMLAWLACGIWQSWPNYKNSGGNLILFILLLLLGWQVFGPPVHK